MERADDMGLPPRVVNVRRDYFTEEEEEVIVFPDLDRSRAITDLLSFNRSTNPCSKTSNASSIPLPRRERC